MGVLRAIIVVGAAVLVVSRASAQRSPSADPDVSSFIPFCRGESSSPGIAIGDVNGDGRLDVVFGNGRHSPQPNLLYVNGSRRDLFFEPRLLGNSATYGVVLTDVDGDGDLDLIEGNDYGFWSVVWLNDGRGNYVAESYFGREDQTHAIAAGDLTGDGRPDVVVANRSDWSTDASKVYVNDGKGRFAESRLLAGGSAKAVAVALGDYNGDGHLDIVLGTLARYPNYLLLNDGTGRFPRAAPFGPDTDVSGNYIAAGDLDADGHLDVVAVNRGQASRIYFGDGKGGFPKSTTFGSDPAHAYAVTLGDMNGDGSLDVVVAYDALDYLAIGVDGTPAAFDSEGLTMILRRPRVEPNRVFLNDGHGRLRPGPTFGASATTARAVAVGDIDGDGRLDIVVGNNCANNALYLNRDLALPRR